MRCRGCSSTRDSIECGRCGTNRESRPGGRAICVSGSWQRVYCASHCPCTAQNTFQLCNFVAVGLLRSTRRHHYLGPEGVQSCSVAPGEERGDAPRSIPRGSMILPRLLHANLNTAPITASSIIDTEKTSRMPAGTAFPFTSLISKESLRRAEL